MSSNIGQDINNTQQQSLDATDALASVWSIAVAEAAASNDRVSWGGRGKGGRGTARRTFQPFDIVVDSVDLEYMNDASVTGAGGGGSKVLLSNAYIKLLPGRVYSLIGRNGVGKSSFLKRIEAGKIPGFPPHITSLLVPQEVFGHDDLTPIDIVLEKSRSMKEQTKTSNEYTITQLEEQMDSLDMGDETAQEKMEEICNQIAELEEDGEDEDDEIIIIRAHDALCFFGVPESVFSIPTSKLSGGTRKKIALACSLMERPQLLLLDEPTCHIDVGGILQLRQLIADCVASKTTVVLISHDVDLMNDVATDVIHFHQEQLGYYPGNYSHFMKYRKERITHQLKQAGALEKQRANMVKSIDNLKKKTEGKSNETKKKLMKAAKSKEKKLERHGVEKNEQGHRRTAQTDGGMRIGCINAVGAEKRKNLTHKELVKLADVDIGPVPDKAVQFDFQNTTNVWGDEPLVSIMDVGHGYDEESKSNWTELDHVSSAKLIFDCVDISIREGSRITILGENGSGKTTLLSIISGELSPSQGQVHFASGLKIAHFHQHAVDDLMYDQGGTVTAHSYLSDRFKHLSKEQVTQALVRFGLSLKQASTNIRFLSGGERCRLCMADIMLEKPDLIVVDEILHLDVESVEALIYGLNKWNGTLVMASHDANLIRSIGADTFVLYDGTLRRVANGIDSYLEIFASMHKPK